MKARLTTFVALLAIALLLTAMIGASAYTPAKKNDEVDGAGRTRANPHETISLTTTVPSELKEKALKAIKKAEEKLEEACALLEEAEVQGLETQLLKELLEEAENALEAAKELIESMPSKALALAKKAEAIARSIIESIERLLRHIEVNQTETEQPDVGEVLEELKAWLEDLAAKAKELSEQGVDVAKLMELLGKVKVILDQLEAELPENAEEILNEARDLLREAEELLTELAEQTQTTTTTTEATTAETTTTETTATTAPAETTTASPTTTTTTTQKTETTTTAQTSAAAAAIEREMHKEVRVEIGGEEGEARVVVEQTMQMTKYANGTTALIKEQVVTVGNKTLLKISKILKTDGEKKVEHEVVIERNQTIVGAVVNIKPMNFSMIRVDQSLNVSVLEMERNRLKLRLSAPNGTPGRLIVIELEPGAVDLNNLESFEVMVNGQPAVLASGILDLASGVYEEPAYVFVISSKGASVLLYIPHFSEYTIDILGILSHAAEAASSALRAALSNTSIAVSTITATIVLLAAAALTARRRSLLRRL